MSQTVKLSDSSSASENERSTEGEGPNNASLNKVVGNRQCLQIHGQVLITLCDG